MTWLQVLLHLLFCDPLSFMIIDNLSISHSECTMHGPLERILHHRQYKFWHSSESFTDSQWAQCNMHGPLEKIRHQKFWHSSESFTDSQCKLSASITLLLHLLFCDPLLFMIIDNLSISHSECTMHGPLERILHHRQYKFWHSSKSFTDSQCKLNASLTFNCSVRFDHLRQAMPLSASRSLNVSLKLVTSCTNVHSQLHVVKTNVYSSLMHCTSAMLC